MDTRVGLDLYSRRLADYLAALGSPRNTQVRGWSFIPRRHLAPTTGMLSRALLPHRPDPNLG